MAKAAEKTVNKSAAIREALAENPNATANEIVSALGEKGIKIEAGLVYAIKGKMNQKSGEKKRQSAPVTGDVIGIIGSMGSFIKAAGGVEQAKKILDAIP